jgi:hypothetical protein
MATLPRHWPCYDERLSHREPRGYRIVNALDRYRLMNVFPRPALETS